MIPKLFITYGEHNFVNAFGVTAGTYHSVSHVLEKEI